MNATKRHIYRVARRMMLKSSVRGGSAFGVDDIWYEAVMSPNLPGTLSHSTVRKYLNEFADAEFPTIERVKYGRSVLYRIKKIDFFAMPALKPQDDANAMH